jgi:hypothetical protein
MNSQKITIIIFAALSASLALADDFKTTKGKEYKDATVTGVEPDGIVVKTKSGISKLYFAELPQDVQQRFHYNPQTAAAYSAQQAAHYEAYQNKQEQLRYQREDIDAQNRVNAAAQQAANSQAQLEVDRDQMNRQERAQREGNRHQEALDAISAYRATHTHTHKRHSR